MTGSSLRTTAIVALFAASAAVIAHAALRTNLSLQWYVATVGDVPDRGIVVDLPERVTVVELAHGCYHFDEWPSEWSLDGEEYVCGERRLARERMRVLLDTIVNARTQVPELLEDLGVTQEQFDAHRADVWRACLDPAWLEAGGVAPAIPPEVERVLTLDRLAPALRRLALHEIRRSTESIGLRVTFHGSPQVMVSSSISGMVADSGPILAMTTSGGPCGDAPGMLPWTVEVGDRRWKSCDLAISKAVLELADPKGRLTARLYGPDWWRESLWHDSFWLGAIAEQLLLDVGAHGILREWERDWSDSPFDLEERKCWKYVSFDPLGVVFVLRVKAPGPVDVVKWCDPIRDGRLAGTREELLQVLRDADAAVARRAWLVEWKRSKPRRELQLMAHGARGHRSRGSEPLVEPAWRDAGLTVEPEFHLLGQYRHVRPELADFRLPADSDATLILSLESPPDYTFVDASGREEVRKVRTLPK